MANGVRGFAAAGAMSITARSKRNAEAIREFPPSLYSAIYIDSDRGENRPQVAVLAAERESREIMDRQHRGTLHGRP
jgi:hypothetical protein